MLTHERYHGGIARRQPKSGTRKQRQRVVRSVPRAPRPLVVDTNVVLDIASIHDLSREAADGGADIEYRRERARNGLLLVCYCHERRVRTLSLDELSVMLRRLVPPDEEGLDGYFVRLFLHFVKDRLLRHWDFQLMNGTEGISRTDADARYLQVAKEENLALITNEGLTRDGIRDPLPRRSLRAKAQAAAVPVFTAGELLIERRVDTTRLAAEFIDRWDAAEPGYIGEYVNQHPGDRGSIVTWMSDARRIYTWILDPTAGA